ncbi:MAG: Lrp/AsnC family transcriptional regulator [Candidatus Thermoplasmatota archaeon]|jgi:DNA-binding Lrp family transcriptional regulator|nr:Lrp/AsnC family transcriptional regulator [Candidatus Thermoplasmatota archaeon]
MTGELDDLDWTILKMLKEDSRRTNVAIAGELKVSEGMVRQRIARLRSDGMVKRFTIETASRGLKAIVEVNIDVNVLTGKIAKRIKALKGVERVYEISGDTDIMVIVDVANTIELNTTIEAIRALGNVRSTKTRLILGEQ